MDGVESMALETLLAGGKMGVTARSTDAAELWTNASSFPNPATQKDLFHVVLNLSPFVTKKGASATIFTQVKGPGAVSFGIGAGDGDGSDAQTRVRIFGFRIAAVGDGKKLALQLEGEVKGKGLQKLGKPVLVDNTAAVRSAVLT